MKKNSFDNFVSVIHKLKGKPASKLTDKELVELICGGCRFYSEGKEKKLYCAAFEVLSYLIREGEISFEEISRILPR